MRNARVCASLVFFLLTEAPCIVTEPQSDSEPAHDRGARTSLQLLTTTGTVSWRLYAVVEQQHVGVFKPGLELIQLDAVLGPAERPCELSATCDEHTELYINTHIVLGKYFLSMTGRLSS